MFSSDKLLLRAFTQLKTLLNKHELRHLLHKLRLAEENISSLEETYHGRDHLKDRIFHSLVAWKDDAGGAATMDELIRILHIINMREVSCKMRKTKIYSQAIRL